MLWRTYHFPYTSWSKDASGAMDHALACSWTKAPVKAQHKHEHTHQEILHCTIRIQKALPNKQAQVEELHLKCLKNSCFGRQFCPLLTIYKSLTWNWRHLIWCSQKSDNKSHFYIAVFGQSQTTTLHFAIIRWFGTTWTVLHHINCQKQGATPYQNMNFGEIWRTTLINFGIYDGLHQKHQRCQSAICSLTDYLQL